MNKKERLVFRKIRKGAKISQAQLAKETGIAQSKLSGWESGQVDLTPDEEFSIGEALDAVIKKRGIPGVVTPEQATEDLRKGAVLARLRDQYAVTQMQLAKKSGITQSAISAFEKGYVDLSQEQVDTLFKAFNEVLEDAEIAVQDESLKKGFAKLAVLKSATELERYEKSQLVAELNQLREKVKTQDELLKLQKQLLANHEHIDRLNDEIIATCREWVELLRQEGIEHKELKDAEFQRQIELLMRGKAYKA
jgi:transcriptional regulator with XRE-family HTH domain